MVGTKSDGCRALRWFGTAGVPQREVPYIYPLANDICESVAAERATLLDCASLYDVYNVFMEHEDMQGWMTEEENEYRECRSQKF